MSEMRGGRTPLSGDHSSEQLNASILAENRPGPSAPGIGRVNETWTPRPGHRYCGHRLAVKRLIDLVGAGSILVVATPLLALIALAIRLSSPGPAVYRQVRVGRGGQRFTILKFRTMHDNADRQLRKDPELWDRYVGGGFKLALNDDPRITRLGAVLRKASLDELPQLVNVVRGDMSLVGPRPVVPEELEQYGAYLDAYLLAMPGVTGAWQVAGREAVRFPGRARLDAEYLDEWSLGRDLCILLRTVPATLTARDVR